MYLNRSEVALPVAAERDVVAFGDVHGHAEHLDRLLDEAARAVRGSDDALLVFLGDLVDRGPDSLACLDLAAGAKARTGVREVAFLCGNHEQMLRVALDGGAKPSVRDVAMGVWIQNGGGHVLRQLGLGSACDPEDVRAALGASRVALLDSMLPYLRVGRFLFVHAGLNPDMDEDRFLSAPWSVDYRALNEDAHWAWVRQPFLDHWTDVGHGRDGSFVVHGHTVSDGQLPFGDNAARWRLNLDGGSYATGEVRAAVIRGEVATVLSAYAPRH